MTGPPDRFAVATACHTLLGATVAEVDMLAASPNSAVYRVTLTTVPERVIVKLYAGRAQWKAGKEHLVLTKLANHAPFHVPEVLATGPVPGLDLTGLILVDLGTHSLHQRIRSDTCSRRDALNLLGRLLTAFHSHPLHNPAPVADILVGRVLALQGRLPPQVLAATRPNLDRLVKLASLQASVWCHGDLHFDNVVFQSGDQIPYVIDFEQATGGPAEYDVAQTAVTTDSFGPDDLTCLLSGYAAAISRDLLTDLIVFHTLRGWCWAARHEGRDVTLWQTRLTHVLNQCATR
jgi:Ser/Thr protein kinase RdoA (MazF antagonist)